MTQPFFTADDKAKPEPHDSVGAFGSNLPEGFFRWRHLSRAQYLEARSLLAGYILSSQGDRVTAGNSIEGRFPFLDYRVAEFAATVPPWHKILGLTEKFILKKAMQPELPKNILARVKQPYMAPDSNSFVQTDSPAYVKELLSEKALAKAGVFEPKQVAKLHAKCAKLADKHLSFKDNMSFVAILSTQLLHHHYVDAFTPATALPRDKFSVWLDKSTTQTESPRGVRN
jgi:asparagine synthase (glutamine-hydrolysing)